jgi:hypothetical protein
MLNIFAFGSGYIEFGIMQAIAQMFSGNQMNVLFASMVALGGVMVAVMTLISGYDRPGSHLTLAKYLLGAMFVYAVLIVPRVTVHIEDTVINTQSNAYVVTGVPFGIGGIMSLFSNIQMDLTQLVETNFSTPQSIDLTNAGMGLSLTSENLADNITISDPYLKRDFTQFVYNCVMPGMSAAGGIDMFDLDMAGAATDNSAATYNSNTAASFWSVVSAYTAGAGANEITTWYSGNGTVTGSASGGDYPQGLTTTCGQETSWMNTAMEYYVDNDAGPALAGSLGETWSQFSTEYGEINSNVYNMSNGATSQFEQMAFANEFSNAVVDSAKLAGLNANSVAYGTAMAQENMNNSFLISGVMASQYLPVAYGIISSLVMAFSVILLLLLFLPTGVNYLKMYFELLMFITVWPPLMAIYNYITDLIIQHNSVSLAGEGFSILTAHSYSTFTSSYLGWVGYMSWSIPMLSYALVTGSTYAMVATLSSVDSAGKSSASAGAKVASTGDLSLGNDSMDNYNANKHNSEWTDVTGQARREQVSGNLKSWQSPGGNYGQTWSDGAGVTTNSYDGQLTGNSDSAIPATLTQSIQGQAVKGFNTAKANVESSKQQLQWSDGKVLSAEWGMGNKIDGSSGKTFQSVATSQFKTALDKAAAKTGKTEQQTFDEIKAQGGLGIDVPLLNQLGAKLNLNTSATAGTKTTWSTSQQQELKTSFGNSLSSQISGSNDIKYSGSGSEFDNLKNARSDQLTASKSYDAAQNKLKQATTGLQTTKSWGATIPEAALLKYGQYKGFDASQAGHFDERFNAGDKNTVAGFMDWVDNGSPEGQKVNDINKQINNKGTKLSNVRPKSSIPQNFQTRKPVVIGAFQKHKATGVTPASSLNKINILEKPVPKIIKPTKIPIKSGGPAKVMNPGQYAYKTFIKQPISDIGAGLGYVGKGMVYGVKNDAGLLYRGYMHDIGKPFSEGVLGGAGAVKFPKSTKGMNTLGKQKYIIKPLTPKQISQNQNTVRLKGEQQKILKGLNPALPKYTPPNAVTKQNTGNNAIVQKTNIAPPRRVNNLKPDVNSNSDTDSSGNDNGGSPPDLTN